jgi:transposase
MSRSGKYSMLTQVQERLKAEGKDHTNISLLSRETKLSRDTIRKYLNEGVKQHKGKGKKRGSKLDPFKEYLHEQFGYRNFNCEALYDRIKAQGYTGGITIVREYVSQYRPAVQSVSVPERTMRFETEYGEQAQMDWGYAHYFDETTSKMRKVACLVLVSGASRKRYVEFFSVSRQEQLFIGMIHAFIYFGGLFSTILTDMMKSVFDKKRGKEVVFNSRYERFMAELGFSTRLCKPRTPETKGKSERLVNYVKNNFFPGRSFKNLVDLNVQALKWCEQANSKEHKTTGLIPNIEHRREQTHMKPLPPTEILDQYLWVYRRVSVDGMVSYEGKNYGITHTCHDRQVRVCRIGSEVLIVSDSGEIVGQHEMVGNRRMYFHPQQWPNEYRRDNRRGRKLSGFAVQQAEWDEYWLDEQTNIAAYDDVLTGGFG